MLILRRFFGSNPARIDTGLAALLFLSAFAVYLQTMRRSFAWGDPSEMATAAYFLGIGHSPGYPTYMLIAYPFAHLPFATVAFRVNMMSALFGAVAVTLSYFVFRRIIGSRLGAFVAAASFAFTASFWDVTTEADVHTLHIAFMTAILLLLLKWRESGRPHLAWIGLLFGLSLGNHALTVLMIPAALLLVAITRGWRFLLTKQVLAACMTCFAGLTVYAYLAIRGPAHPPPGVSDPQNLHQVLLQITAPGARESMFDVPMTTVLRRIGQFAVSRLPLDVTWPGIILGFVGIPVLIKRNKQLLVVLAIILALNVLYSVNFSIFDIYAYFIISYWVWCVFIGAGGAWCATLVAHVIASIQRTEDSIGARSRLALAGALLLALPFWIATDHWSMIDASDDRSAEQFARATLDHVEKNAVVLGDWWTTAPLGYLKYIEGVRPDVTLLPVFSYSDKKALSDQTQPGFLGSFSAVYGAEMLTYCMKDLRKRYIVVPEGPVSRIFTDGPEPDRVRTAYRGQPQFTFDGKLALVGWQKTDSSIRPGVLAPITLYWQPVAQAPAGVQYQVLLSFEREEESGGVTCAWRDRNPVAHGMLPPTQWVHGQTLTEPHTAFITSEDFQPGQYHMTVRIRETRNRRSRILPVVNAAGMPVGRTAVLGSVMLEEGDETGSVSAQVKRVCGV